MATITEGGAEVGVDSALASGSVDAGVVEGPIDGKASELIDIIGSFNDVTERLKRSHEVLGREVARLREQLDQKDRELERRERLAALGQMAAGVAHEIRNPLGGIGLYASLLVKELGDREEARRMARSIQTGVRSLERIVNDILIFAGGGEPRVRRVQLGEVLEDVLGLTLPQRRARGIAMIVDAEVKDAEVCCDVGQVRRALLNIVVNAVDASPAGGRIVIRLDDGAGEDRVGVVVEDDGPGVPEVLLDRVFNPFFTTKDSGTGLGLAIVHRIAEANGGQVMVENRAEGGARFTLVLPAGHGVAVGVG